MEKRHPAYADPSYPTNQILGYMLNEQMRSTWAEPRDIAIAIYHVVSRGQVMPIRLPLGSDAWGWIMADLERTKKELEGLKDVSLGVGDAAQLESIAFLK